MNNKVAESNSSSNSVKNVDIESLMHLKDEETSSLSVRIFKTITKISALLTCLYCFVVSLNLMSISFPLIGGKYASEAFRSNVVLTNPFAGLMIGLLSTVVVQSSSTSTSIIVSMVASEIIPVKYAIPIIMGTNIGTSVTSTLVSLGQASNKEKFRRSFSGATIHDMFNVLTVLVLLPVELLFGYLEKVSHILVGPLNRSNPNAKEPEMLNAITKPLTDAIIQIDKAVLDKIATAFNNQSNQNVKLIKTICKSSKTALFSKSTFELNETLNTTTDFFQQNESLTHTKCNFLFAHVNWQEWLIGLILLVISLVALSSCLVILVKILSSVFKGQVAVVIQKVVNSDFPGVFKYFTGLIAIILGCLFTIVVQSSSVFTSTLTPLVGMGIVSVERVFPLTLGSNIGTTVTGILASLSGPSRTLQSSLQIALCHTLFNISGILIWYPIPFLRRIPIRMANKLGEITAEYRWFAFVYIVGLFFIIPIFTFVISMLGKIIFSVILTTITVFITFLVLVNVLQKHKPNFLPESLRTFDFLPKPLRSLQPYDNFIRKYLCFCRPCQKIIKTNQATNGDINNSSNNSSSAKIVMFTNDAFLHEKF